MFRNLMLITFGMLALMLGIGYFSADPESLKTPRQAQVIDLFDRLAFSGAEARYGDKGAPASALFVHRWTQPVKISVIGKPASEAADSKSADSKPAEGQVLWGDAVRRMAEVYDGLPGLEVSVDGNYPWQPDSLANAAGNLVIVTLPAKEIEAMAESMPPAVAAALTSDREGCAVTGDEPAVLARVTILLRDDLGGSRRSACLGEKMAAAFGYAINAKLFSDVFRVRDDRLSFHPLGRMAAALLYDPALEPGMSRDQALSVVRGVLAGKGLKE